jgi:hypothetical protein
MQPWVRMWLAGTDGAAVGVKALDQLIAEFV